MGCEGMMRNGDGFCIEVFVVIFLPLPLQFVRKSLPAILEFVLCLNLLIPICIVFVNLITKAKQCENVATHKTTKINIPAPTNTIRSPLPTLPNS